VPTGANGDAHFAKMLETTQNERLRRNRPEWLEQNNEGYESAREAGTCARLAPTTQLDYPWRLRVRANYRDMSTFLMSGLDDDSHATFHNGLSPS
jgi:hypothetical protein